MDYRSRYALGAHSISTPPADIPPEIKCELDIRRTEEEWRKYFEAVIKEAKEKRKIYFQQRTWEKIDIDGYLKKKANDQTQSYDLGVLRDRFKVHVLRYRYMKRIMKYKDIEKEVYPERKGKPIGRILKEARNLIRNAWLGDFPGNYRA